jgi:hypothetical protein
MRHALPVISVILALTGCDRAVYESCDEELPAGLLRPVPGEVSIVQLRLNGSAKHGEAAIIVGADGTLVLLDVGNSNHTTEVLDAVRDLNTHCLTPTRGYPRARRPLEVEWIVLTHFHGDHAGSLEELFTDEPRLDLTRGVIHRGWTNVGGALNAGTFESACRLLHRTHAAADFPLCEAEAEPPCDEGSWNGAHPSVRCPGLVAGSLETEADDGEGLPSQIPLGAGARLVLVAAGGFAFDGTAVRRMLDFGQDENNEENARSVVGLVEHGDFRYHFGGDLTGEGADGVPDVETPLVEIAGPTFYGTLGADVVHAHHHLRDTSSLSPFVELVAPADGRSRNVVGGIAAHVGSPHGDVLSRFADGGRLGEGRIWATRTATGGDEHPALVDADAAIVVTTTDGGRAYFVEAARADAPTRMRFDSVRAF